ncbi:IS256 family transposase, partial [Nocardia sp. NPDC049190]
MTDVVDRETGSAGDGFSDSQLRALVDQARVDGLQLTGEGGLLGRLTELVVESALQGEMDDH